MAIDSVQPGSKVDLLPLQSNIKVKTPQPKQTATLSPPATAEKHVSAPVALPEPERVTVSIDASRELVYRFVDARTGDVISQTPPEQVLEVVRGIQDLLRAEERNKTPGVNVRG